MVTMEMFRLHHGVYRYRCCCVRSKQAMARIASYTGDHKAGGGARGRVHAHPVVHACLPPSGATNLGLSPNGLPTNNKPTIPPAVPPIVGDSKLSATQDVSQFVTSVKTPSTQHVTNLSVRTPASTGEVGEVGEGIQGYGILKGSDEQQALSDDELASDTGDFDIPLAVALAGTAFEAYADVESKGIVHHCGGGADIIYTDVDFLKCKMAGLLTIRSAHLIERTPFLDRKLEDPKGVSVDISVGDSFIHLDDGNQLSMDDNSLFVHDVERARLSVQVQFTPDSEKGRGTEGKECVQGTGIVPLANIASDKLEFSDQEKLQSTVTVPLSDQESFDPTGFSIVLEFVYSPFSSEKTEVAAREVAEEVAGEAEMSFNQRSNGHGNNLNKLKDNNRSNLVGSPGPALMTEEWLRLWENVAEAAASSLFTPIAFIENQATDTQVWIMMNKEKHQLVVSFRGTVHTSWRDLLTDITLTPMTLDARKFANSPRRAAISQLSAESSTIDKVFSTVSQAKKDISLKTSNNYNFTTNSMATAATSRKQTSRVAGNAAGAEAEACDSTSEAEHEEGVVHKVQDIVSSAVGAVSETATELQALMDRVTTLTHHGYHEHGIESPPPGEAWVHSGFLSAYDSVRGPVLGLVDAALAGEDPQTWTVLLTGHSLGGALATLCAFDLSHRSWGSRACPHLQMYNYGSPRVGNKAFAEAYNEQVPNTWRIVNGNDAVTAVPRLLGYCHVGHAVYLRPDGSIDIQRDSINAPFEGVAIPHVLPAMGTAVAETVVAKVVPSVMKGAAAEMIGVTLPEKEKRSIDEAIQGEVEAAGAACMEQIKEVSSGEFDAVSESNTNHVTAEQLSELWEQERQAWASLLGGDAMSEHMEDYYFKGIEQAVEAWRKGILS